jgi:hypothetical protein
MEQFIKTWLFRRLRPYQRPRTRTVRYAFPAIVLTATLMGAMVLNSTQESTVYIEADTTAVIAGEPFRVDVMAYAHTPVNAIDIAVTLPETLVTVGGVDTGESVITLWTEEPYYADGVVYLRGGTFRKGFVGRHKVASINVVAKETGLAEFLVSDVQFLAGDGSGSSVAVTAQNDVQKVYIANDVTDLTTGGGALQADIALTIVTDIDGDGDVSLADVSRFMMAWQTRSAIYDFSGDGQMTFRDFAIILSDSFFK